MELAALKKEKEVDREKILAYIEKQHKKYFLNVS